MKKEKIENSQTNLGSKGITLVALVVTIIVLLILAGVTITALLGDSGIIKNAGEAANITNEAIQQEQSDLSELSGMLDDAINSMPVPMPSGWDSNKVVAVKSDDGKVVPVPIGFTKSTVSGEGSVDTGFVIKQGSDGSATSGINEFVWVPVSNPSEMFGTDAQGNSLGKLYSFDSGSPQPINWTEENGVMSWTSAIYYREPDILKDYDGSDATKDSSSFTSTIGNITGAQFKEQLQQEFEDMRDSVETYGGFYIGRYETGNLNEDKAVVQKNNTDIEGQNWYVMYNRCKTIAQGTSGTSSMIWGCQWDATLKWFLESSDESVRKYVTNNDNKGNYSDTIPTGSNNNYSVNKIYDMVGNVDDCTLEANDTLYRVYRRWLLSLYRFVLSGFWTFLFFPRWWQRLSINNVCSVKFCEKLKVQEIDVIFEV